MLGLLLSTAVSAAAPSLATARETVSQWVQAQQLLSRTQTEWASDRELLEQSKALFERELQAVQIQLGQVSTNSTVAEREREQADTELKSLTEALDAGRGIVAELEVEVRRLLPLLPPPLLTTVEPLTNRLPADPASTKASVTERLQTVVALLNEVDKFQNAVAIASEKQPNAAGELVAVEVVYVGLGVGYFVDATGDVAGVGYPSASGWTWTRQPELAGRVRDVVAMYRNQKPAAFVGLPARVQ